MKAKGWVWVVTVGGAGSAFACGDETNFFLDGTGTGTGTETATSTSTGTGTGTGTSTATVTGTGTGTGTQTGTSTQTGTGTSTQTGTGTGTGTGTIVGCGDLTYTEPACETCMNTSCCAQKAACASGTDCDQVLQCIIFSCDGSDPTCEGSCKNNNAAGAAAYDAMNACLETNCPTCLATFCGTAIGFPSGVLNACVNDSCCPSANACVNDPDCQLNCLLNDPPPASCASDPLYVAFSTCLDTNCPGDVCGSGIGFFEDNEPVIDCHQCLSQSCCSQMLACADPSGNGNMGVNDPEVAACLDCLTASPFCVGGAIEAAADSFDACLAAECAAPCN